jgi:hypothetical protein
MKFNKILILSLLFINALSLSLLKNKKNMKQKDYQLTNKDLNDDEDNQNDFDVIFFNFIF